MKSWTKSLDALQNSLFIRVHHYLFFGFFWFVSTNMLHLNVYRIIKLKVILSFFHEIMNKKFWCSSEFALNTCTSLHVFFCFVFFYKHVAFEYVQNNNTESKTQFLQWNRERKVLCMHKRDNELHLDCTVSCNCTVLCISDVMCVCFSLRLPFPYYYIWNDRN